MSHERLAVLIQAHQAALLAHPEAQTTHEAMINLLQGGDMGEITVAHRVRLLCSQAVLVCTVQNTLRQGSIEHREPSAGR